MFNLDQVTVQQLEDMAERAKRAYEKETDPARKKEKHTVWQTRLGDIDRKKRGVTSGLPSQKIGL